MKILYRKKLITPPAPIKYGLLYNYFAAIDARGISPAGWHVPTETDFDNLGIALGGDIVAGGKLKSVGTTDWFAPNTAGDNSSGFNARPAGGRFEPNGIFGSMFTNTRYLSSTVAGTNCRYRGLIYNQSDLLGNGASNNKKQGSSIRLIKNDAVDLGTVTDFDGNIYPTVKIGVQVWMAANLAVKHYNNGDQIPVVTDNLAWMALVTGGCCAYNNDLSFI